MNEAQKKFIKNELIPFILREQGCGFAMQSWWEEELPGTLTVWDGIKRKTPKCGSVCCIGGTVQMLKKLPSGADRLIAQVMGLTYDEALGLFYA